MKPAGDALIGTGRCIVCSQAGARVSLMKTGRVCMTCNACMVQVMTRGDISDQLVRDEVLTPAPAAAPAADPAPAPAPAAAPAAPSRPGWGVLAW